jgi:excisionase family DNA binding protein
MRQMTTNASDPGLSSAGPPCTVDQAAEALNVKKSTIRAWIAQRRLGHVRLGRAVRIPPSEIQRLLEAGYVPPERNR